MAKATTRKHFQILRHLLQRLRNGGKIFVGRGVGRAVNTDKKHGFSRGPFRIELQPAALPHIEWGMNKIAPPSISVVHPDRFSKATSQTPGSRRLAAVSPDLGIHSALWAGTFLVEPGAQTGIHHHGAQETVAYVLEGESFIQWGDRGEHSLTARVGDFLHVPAWLVHREINRSKDTPFHWVVIRSSSEPIVVNLPEDAWK